MAGQRLSAFGHRTGPAVGLAAAPRLTLTLAAYPLSLSPAATKRTDAVIIHIAALHHENTAQHETLVLFD